MRNSDADKVLSALRKSLATSVGVRGSGEASPTGVPGLDHFLPGGGWQRGSVVECLSHNLGDSAFTFVLATTRQTSSADCCTIIMDWRSRFFPAAMPSWGCALDRIRIVRASSAQEELWALEQVLRCPGVRLAVCWNERLSAMSYRRLQLAAEAGGSAAFLFRPVRVVGEPSWASVRLRIDPVAAPTCPRRIRLTCLRGQGSAVGRSVVLELDDETGAVRVVSELAGAASRRRAAGA